MKHSLSILLIIVLLGCQTKDNDMLSFSINRAGLQLESAIAHKPEIPKNYGPRTMKDGKVKYIDDIHDWTLGFFPGSLWYLYNYTKDDVWKKRAERFTLAIEDAKYNTENHDIGFVIQCSFGNGFRLTQNPHYKDVMIEAAHSLCTRFNPNVGCILSWNVDKGWQSQRGWHYPVIIDNMMNLELLFNATRFTGDSTFYKIAVSHADKTMENHFRPDYSSYHVIDYDIITGQVRNKHTAQGYAHESAWARGQAWGLYGFVMCYRETKDERYLKQAQNIADWWIHNKNLPDDMIPYWDFNAPEIPDTYRDASAAAITASALIELSSFDTPGKKRYFAAAKKTLTSLSSSEYLSETGQNGYFIIKHCVGSIPHNQEIDVPLNYADYYFLEALNRIKK